MFHTENRTLIECSTFKGFQELCRNTHLVRSLRSLRSLRPRLMQPATPRRAKTLRTPRATATVSSVPRSPSRSHRASIEVLGPASPRPISWSAHSARPSTDEHPRRERAAAEDDASSQPRRPHLGSQRGRRDHRGGMRRGGARRCRPDAARFRARPANRHGVEAADFDNRQRPAGPARGSFRPRCGRRRRRRRVAARPRGPRARERTRR